MKLAKVVKKNRDSTRTFDEDVEVEVDALLQVLLRPGQPVDDPADRLLLLLDVVPQPAHVLGRGTRSSSTELLAVKFD